MQVKKGGFISFHSGHLSVMWLRTARQPVTILLHIHIMSTGDNIGNYR